MSMFFNIPYNDEPERKVVKTYNETSIKIEEKRATTDEALKLLS